MHSWMYLVEEMLKQQKACEEQVRAESTVNGRRVLAGGCVLYRFKRPVKDVQRLA